MTSQVTGLGPVNGHVVGILNKEMMRRAIETIRNERMAFEVMSKQGYGGAMDDVFTSADRAAQDVYLRTIKECFPNAGIIAEEDSLRIECKGDCKAYFTVDPLDGTKAFVRRQSHGVGSMLALVNGHQVVSAYVGDVNTCEMYGYRPDSEKVHRISEFSVSQELSFGLKRPLKEQYVLLRDPETSYGTLSRKFIKEHCKSYEIAGGSIGIWMTRLWKREFGAVIMPWGWETPWDSTPIIGISLKLGYRFFRAVDNREYWQELTPILLREKYHRNYDVLIVHANDVPDIGKFQAL